MCACRLCVSRGLLCGITFCFIERIRSNSIYNVQPPLGFLYNTLVLSKTIEIVQLGIVQSNNLYSQIFMFPIYKFTSTAHSRLNYRLLYLWILNRHFNRIKPNLPSLKPFLPSL